MNRNNSIVILALLMLLAACTYTDPRSNADKGQVINNRSVAAPAGETIFLAKCVACHGADGTAGIANAANLKTSQLDSTLIIQTITNGRGGMPSFKNGLTEDEIHKLKDYVYSLRK